MPQDSASLCWPAALQRRQINQIFFPLFSFAKTFLRRFRNLLDFLTQTKSDALAAHVITHCFDDLLVDEISMRGRR